MEFFIIHKSIFVIIHALAAAIGLGAVAVTDTLFFKFLKDFKISKSEDATLRAISQLIWVIIGVLFVSGLVLFLTAPMDYLEKSKFVAKLVIFGVVVLNGILLNWLSPHLRRISFGPVVIQPTRKLRWLRRIAFASGAVSIVSWFSVFILGSLRSIPITTLQALLVYFGIVLLSVIGSQLFATYLKYWRK